MLYSKTGCFMDKKFIRKLGISVADEYAIKEKVAEVEKRTSGEIALAIAKESDAYSAVELLYAISAVFLSGLIFIFFAEPINNFLSSFTWLPSLARLLSAFLVFQTLVMLLVILFLNISPFERILIPKKLKLKNVKKRAYIHFLDSGLYKTKEQSGVLIFVSVLERTVFVFADSGISAKVEQSEWNHICKGLAKSLKDKKAGKGFLKAIEECGEILIKTFPTKASKANELVDGLVVLQA